MKDILAIIDLHSSSSTDLLINKRPLASTTFLGRYAFIDFILSNLVDCGIDNIAILAQNNFRSITKHLGPSSTYLRNTKTGFLNVLVNEKSFTNPAFNTDIHNILENDYILFDSSCEYVLVCPANIIYRINFQKALDEHIASGKKISMFYKSVNDVKEYLSLDKVVVDSVGNAQKFERVSPTDQNIDVSLNTYIIDIDLLKNIILKADTISNLFTLHDAFKYLAQYEENMHCIKYDKYARVIDSLEAYYKYSFEILDKKNGAEHVFNDKDLLLTTTHNSRPVLYGANASVSNSIIANGSYIDGTVNNSIISRDIVIEEGAKVENSILFTHTIVRKGIHLKNVIADKRCEFKTKKEVSGSEKNPLYIPRGEII